MVQISHIKHPFDCRTCPINQKINITLIRCLIARIGTENIHCTQTILFCNRNDSLSDFINGIFHAKHLRSIGI